MCTKKKWPTYKNRKNLSAFLSQNNKVTAQISVCVSSPTALYVLIKISVYFTVYNNHLYILYNFAFFVHNFSFFLVLFFEYVSKSLFLPVPHVAEFPQCGINNIQNYYYSAVWLLLKSPIWTSNKHRQKDFKKKRIFYVMQYLIIKQQVLGSYYYFYYYSLL